MSEAQNEYDDLLDGTDHPWRKRLIALAVLAALVAAGAYALWATLLGGGGSTAAEIQTATVQRGSISQTLSTTGVTVAQSTADLSFGQSGTVSAVNVTLGQEVKQGDVLAEITSDDLQSAVTTAELNLASAEAKLDDLLAGPTKSESASADQSVMQAQAALDKAERALQDLMGGPSDSDLLAAQQAVASAQSQLDKAEQSREQVYTASDDALAAAQEVVSKDEDALANAERTVDDAVDSIGMAKLSLLTAADTYCDTDGHLYDICKDFSIPLTDSDVRKLTDSIEEQITASGARAQQVQDGAQATPTTTPQQTGSNSQQQTGSDLVSVTTNLISANTSYKNALASKSSADDAVESAKADLQAAQSDVEEAKKGPSSTDIAAADNAVASAQLSLDDANAKLAELQQGPAEDDLADAQASIDSAAVALDVAKAKRDEVYAGATSQEIESQRAQVVQAELSAAKARKDLEKAQLIAPFDGTVAELNVEVGEDVSASGTQAAITLNTPNALRLQLNITESDVLNVKADQTGIATFDALESAAFPIVIESVGTNPTTTQGVVTYQAWARVLAAPTPVGAGASLRGGSQTAILTTASQILGMTEDELRAALESGQTLVQIAEARGMAADDFQTKLMEQVRGTAAPGATASPTPSAADSGSTEAAGTSAKPLPGMNASVTIIVDQAQNVLTVPESAVQSEGRNSVVEVQKDDGSTEKMVVQTGLSDGTNTEITDGLEEGQTVIIPTRAATTSATQTTGFPRGGFIISGEGGPPEGGAGGPINIQVGP